MATSLASMQAKLKQYRAGKMKSGSAKGMETSWVAWESSSNGINKTDIDEDNKKLIQTKSQVITSQQSPFSFLSSFYTQVLIASLFWIGAIVIQFGIVYFILACMYFLWKFGFSKSNRSSDNADVDTVPTDAEVDNGPSAYSVFNPECERLNGTFTAEEFDRGLRSGFRS